jgi:hypothetical protein
MSLRVIVGNSGSLLCCILFYVECHEFSPDVGGEKEIAQDKRLKI